jgi:folliculin
MKNPICAQRTTIMTLLCFGHFCERHGPSILFCTENISENAVEESMSTLARALASRVRDPRGDDTSSSTTATTSSSQVPSCPMCHSLYEGQLVSNDTDESGGLYLSRRFPDEATSYARVRSACVRALSCELCPGREGPVLFGDDEGAALSYLFRVRDIEARGCARWFCIILLSPDAHHLTNCRESVTRYDVRVDESFTAATLQTTACGRGRVETTRLLAISS